MRLTWIATALRDAGLDVVEHPGWKTHQTGSTWLPKFGVVHATAAPRQQADSTQVAVVRDGRTGLPGPIANCVVTRDGRWHVVAAGRCNTTLPGTAGPFKGKGNTFALGVEGCNDNRGEPWPAEQYRSYVRGWAAICRRLGWTADRLVGHREHTPGHKTDPTFNMNQFRGDVAAVLAGKDDDVTAQQIWTEPVIELTAATAARLNTTARPVKATDKRAPALLLQDVAIDAADAATRATEIKGQLAELLTLARGERLEVPPTAEQNAQATVDLLGSSRQPADVAATLRAVPGVDWRTVGQLLAAGQP